MAFIERMLFYPVLIAASVLVTREALVNSSPLAYGALAGLALVWLFTLLRAFFWLVRATVWLAVAAGLVYWFSTGR